MGAYNDDVLFIHIPKCGGTACKEYMAEHLPDIKWPRPAWWFAIDDGRDMADIRPQDEERANASVEDSKLPIGHIPLRDIERWTGRPPESWERIIAVIRNPYEQQLSQWWFWRERYAMGQFHANDIHAAKFPRIDGWLETPEADFHLWYEARFNEDSPLVKNPPSMKTDYAGWGGFYPYWLAVDDAIPDNVVILRQELLSHQFPVALAPWIDGPPPELHKSNTTGHKHWSLYYHSQRALDIVHRKFIWTFDVAKAYPNMVFQDAR